MKKISLMRLMAILALGVVTTSLYAQENARWIRKSSISADGSSIVFAYQGDIYSVASTGGIAKQITSNSAYDSDPLWTADGKNVVFSSYREGSKDIWIVSAEGGKPRRLTSYPGAETPLFVSKDGQVYYSADIQADSKYNDLPWTSQVYTVNIKDGKSSLFTSIPMSKLSINNNGIVIYEDVKGYEDEFRKHHTSSVTRDVWKYLPKRNQYIKLSRFDGENRNPVFASDGKDYYYLSEQSGNFNIWKSNINAPEEAIQISNLPTHPIRNLSISSGNTLAFSYNGDLYTLIPGEKALKLNIQIISDKQSKDLIHRNISSNITDLAVSPNGKEIAVVAHGDVFVIAPELKVSKRITNTPSQERNVSFSKDGRTLYYSAERNGNWSIWKTELLRAEDKFFALSYETKEKLFSKSGQTCFQPKVSPDGKWVAFLRDRTELVIKGTEKGEEKSLLKGANYSYSDGDIQFEWSDDSKNILSTYQADGGWNNEDIAVINIENGKITNLTQSGYSDNSFRWALGGKAMIWESDKNGYRSHGSWGAHEDIYAMFFDIKEYNKFVRTKEEDSIEAYIKEGKDDAEKAEKEKKKKKSKKDEEKKDSSKVEEKVVELLFEGREDRIVRLTPVSGQVGDCFLSADGKTLYFFRVQDSGMDLCSMNCKDKDFKVIRKGMSGRFYPSADKKTLYILGGRGINKLDVASAKIESVEFSSDYDYQPAKEREYIFEHICKQVEEKFYDKKLHGVDWKAFCNNYRAFLPYIDNNFDFQELLSELLGELNASHTGARYYAFPSVNAGRLGVLYEQNHKGKGLKIAEVLPGSELSVVAPQVGAGDVILAVDGEEIPEGAQWYDVLRHKAGKRVFLKIKKGKSDKPVEVFVTASRSDSDLLYKRWVAQREKMTAELSDGKVAYIHVEGMDSESYREAYSKLLGKYRNCEAVIVDTRHNGGGWLHDDLASLLNGKAYIEFRPRGQYIGTDPFNKWCKPSCVLIGEDNYSDASGFPYVYRTLGIGKLIGAPVPGTMTAVWWEYQIDPSIVFGIPEVTAWGLNENRALENLSIEPDILVYNTPESLLKGEDLQLQTAVKEMLKEIDARKKK